MIAESYYLEEGILVVWVNVESKYSYNLYTSRNGYEDWLHESGKLEWCQDWSDETGAHQQLTGTFTIEEYWSNFKEKEILKDITEYVNKIYAKHKDTLNKIIVNATEKTQSQFNFSKN
jgi:hypothetical protein